MQHLLGVDGYHLASVQLRLQLKSSDCLCLLSIVINKGVHHHCPAYSDSYCHKCICDIMNYK